MNDSTAHRQSPRSGVLLINLGTPDSPQPGSIRRYLREFLSDRRVVELPRALWLLVLHGFILPLRPRRLAHAYRSVWLPQGSPLLHYSRQQRQQLAAQLSAHYGRDVPVALGMTYGEPSIRSALDELDRAGVRRLLALPLYPQYSATTTAAAFDAVFRVLMQRRWPPELRTVGEYHDDEGYLAALEQSLRTHWAEQGEPDHLLISFHSIPQQYLLKGDPYYCQCQKTARLLAERLQLGQGQWSVSFQSRLGNQPWLQPYTDTVIPQLARSGAGTLDVICPGFAADCLETLEEVAIRYREDFLAAGGKDFRYVPALNDAPQHVDALAQLARRHLDGWLFEAETEALQQQRLGRVNAAKAALKL